MGTSWLDAVIKTAEWAKSDKSGAMSTGYPGLDQYLAGGLHRQRLYICMARPEVGKTTLALNMLRECSNFPTAFASLEMPAPDIVVRMLSIETGEDPDILESEFANADFPERVADSLCKLEKLHIWDESATTWDDLSNWFLELEEKPAILVVDNLMILEGYQGLHEVAKVNRTARDGKKFAMEHDCAVVLIHHIGRMDGDEVDHGHRPLTAERALYGSERDIDGGIGLWRPELEPGLTPGKLKQVENVLMANVVKNRFGPKNLEGVALKWLKPSMRIEGG